MKYFCDWSVNKNPEDSACRYFNILENEYKLFINKIIKLFKYY